MISGHNQTYKEKYEFNKLQILHIDITDDYHFNIWHQTSLMNRKKNNNNWMCYTHNSFYNGRPRLQFHAVKSN